MTFVFDAGAALARIRAGDHPTVPTLPTVSALRPQSVGTIGSVGGGERPDRTFTIECDDFEERAAITEFEAEIPREWAEGFAALQTASPPQGITQARWNQIIDDAGRFLDQWGAKATRLGWTTMDVFGVHPAAPEQRHDGTGLVMLLRGRPIIAITSESATIETPSGDHLRAFRSPNPVGVPLWKWA